MSEVDPEKPGQDAVVDHVPHETAKLGVRTHGSDQLVEGHRIEHQVRAKRVQLERLVVDNGRAGIERQDIFLGCFRVHRDEEIDFLLTRDVVALARSDGVPGWQPGDIGREHVLARDRHAHEEHGTQQHHVGRLASRSVDGGHLNTEIVDDTLARRGALFFLNRKICR
jgi:hypothetical protein